MCSVLGAVGPLQQQCEVHLQFRYCREAGSERLLINDSSSVVSACNAHPLLLLLLLLPADMFVVVHVLAAYQVYINPVFIMCESSLARRTSSGSVNVVVQTLLRMSLVLGVTLVAVLIPFFGSLMVSGT
jgi:hypothetical protein